MSKNKFFKKLLIGGLCALTATAMIGATACDKGGDDNGDDPNPPIVTTDEYTVSFNLDGGSWGKAEGYTVKVEKDGKLSATDIETPTKEGYEFAGWFNGSTPFVVGTTAVTSNITLTAHWSEITAEAKKGVFTVSNSATDVYAAGDTIDDNELFTLKAGVASEYSKGKDGADLAVTGSNAEGGYTANQAIKQSTNVANGAYEKSLYTVTAKANANIKVYVHFVNDSWNSNRAGAKITYSLGSDAVYTIDSVNRTEALRCIEVSIPEGETLTIGAYNTSGSDAKLWLFCVEGEEEVEKTVAVNYYYGQSDVEDEGEGVEAQAEATDLLITTQYVSVGDTLDTPKDPVIIGSNDAFKGWYDAATGGNEYVFGTVAEGTTEVNVYAQYLVSDVTINYYLDKEDTTVYTTVYGFSGQTTDPASGKNKEDGTAFLYWVDEEGEQVDFVNTLWTAGTHSLYAHYDELVEGTLVAVKNFANESATGVQVFTLVGNDENTTQVGTVSINVGSYKSNSVTIDGTSYSKQIQSGAGNNNPAATFTLEEGYTYTITMWLGSSSNGSSRTATITAGEGSELPEGITVAQTTGNGTAAMEECVWAGLSAGTYSIVQ
ncbi:MAG: InlB B-repeat-containing protein, partial [Clostridia bacterium]|nr:InlB B-repeat-containing protein [Clostridia bacterium]